MALGRHVVLRSLGVIIPSLAGTLVEDDATTSGLGMPMPTKRTSKKKNARERKFKVDKKAAKTRRLRVARKAAASKKPETAPETLPTEEQVKEIEERLRTVEFGAMESVSWPRTKKEIQASLKNYKEKLKWARMRGAQDRVDPEVYLHTIEKLEEMLKRTK
jgi:hypothetical protein